MDLKEPNGETPIGTTAGESGSQPPPDDSATRNISNLTSSGADNSKFLRRVTAVNQIVQILALAIAGIWAYWTYSQTVAPSFLTSIQISSEQKAEWSRLNGACVADFKVILENVGPKKISVSLGEKTPRL